MAETSTIEWTDATWNPITGCSLTSPGCTHCYAMTLAGGRLRNHPSRAGLTQDTKAGPVWTGEVRFNEAWLAQPARWSRARRIFVCAHGDLFHESVPVEWIDRVWATMAVNTRHTFQVLTKRSARMRAYVTGLRPRLGDFMETVAEHPTGARPLWKQIDVDHFRSPLPNVWLGVSAEDQPRADERVPQLLGTPAAMRYVSYEPALGPVDFRHVGRAMDLGKERALDSMTGEVVVGRPLLGPEAHRQPFHKRGLDQIILGGESGPRARPMHPEWARHVRDDCAATGVAFLFKQWGSWAPTGDWYADHPVSLPLRAWTGDTWTDDGGFEGEWLALTGKKAAGRELEGRTHDGMPGGAA